MNPSPITLSWFACERLLPFTERLPRFLHIISIQPQKRFFSRLIVLLCLIPGGTAAYAQVKIGDNPTVVNPNSLLELESSNKGLLMPRVDLDSTNSPTPLSAHVRGMIVYNNVVSGAGNTRVVPGFYYNDGNRWVKAGTVDSLSNDWHLTGNPDISAGNNPVGQPVDGNFVGTLNTQALVLGVGAVKRLVLDSLGNGTGGRNNRIFNSNAWDFDRRTYPSASFAWGTDNLDSSFQNATFGARNVIANGLHSNVVGGEGNSLGGFWGWGNAVFGMRNSFTVSNGGANIIGGIENKRVGVQNANAGVLFGYRNIDSTYSSALVGGDENNVGRGVGSSILIGIGNKIITPVFTGWDKGIAASNALFGSGNTLACTLPNGNANSNIMAGNGNALTDAAQSAVFGAENKTSASFSLLAGRGNTATAGMEHAAVLGRYNQPIDNTLLAVGNGTSAAAQSNAVTVTATAAAPAATGNHATLNVNGSFSSSIVTINTDYTIQANDHTVILAASTPLGNNLFFPPANAANKGMELVIMSAIPSVMLFANFSGHINGTDCGGTPCSATTSNTIGVFGGYRFQCGEIEPGSGTYTWWRLY